MSCAHLRRGRLVGGRDLERPPSRCRRRSATLLDEAEGDDVPAHARETHRLQGLPDAGFCQLRSPSAILSSSTGSRQSRPLPAGSSSILPAGTGAVSTGSPASSATRRRTSAISSPLRAQAEVGGSDRRAVSDLDGPRPDGRSSPRGAAPRCEPRIPTGTIGRPLLSASRKPPRWKGEERRRASGCPRGRAASRCRVRSRDDGGRESLPGACSCRWRSTGMKPPARIAQPKTGIGTGCAWRRTAPAREVASSRAGMSKRLWWLARRHSCGRDRGRRRSAPPGARRWRAAAPTTRGGRRRSSRRCAAAAGRPAARAAT